VRKQQIFGTIVTFSVLCLVLSTLLLRAQHSPLPNPDFADALWVAQADGIRKIATTDASSLLHIANLKHVRAVAVDEPRGVLWAYIQNTLWAYRLNGEPALSIPLTPHGDNGNGQDVTLSVNADNGTVWLGVKKSLYHLDTQGQWLSVHTLADHVRASSWDPTTACLWVGTQKIVKALHDTGSTCKAIDLGPHPDVQDITVDPDSGGLWVVMKKGLRRYDADGTLMLEADIDKAAALASDYQGGIWVAADKSLMRLDRTGRVLVDIGPFKGHEKIEALVADPTDASVWVASKRQVSHFRSDGHPLHQLELKGEIRDLALYADLTPPGLALTAPRDGVTLNTNTPSIEMQYHDSGSGVDVETLYVRANDAEVAASCQYGEAGASCTPTTGLPEGVVTLTATVQDYAGNPAEAAEVRVVIDTTPPVIALASPADGTTTNQVLQPFVGSLSELATLTLNGAVVQVGSNLVFQHGPVTLQEGLNIFALSATDAAGNNAQHTVQVTLDTVAPAAAEQTLIQVGDIAEGQGQVSGRAGSVESGAKVTITNKRTGQAVTVSAQGNGSFTAVIAAQPGDVLAITVADAAGNTGPEVQIGVGSSLPPDPSTVAPPLDRTMVTDFATATAFLYSGNHPIQAGVAAEAIGPRLVAVLRGRVKTHEGAPLPGVTVTILGHPEFGQTLTRADGVFDLAVNGGGLLTVHYEKNQYLTVQRQVEAPWRDYVWLPDVVMLPYDPQVTTIDLTAPTAMQVARGSVVTDESGTRQATLLFSPETSATMALPDGTTQSLTTLHVRATEYTVGPDGPNAMPGTLPPTSAYTYAVELSVDEAVAAEATEVRFTQPVVFYVHNFLAFPVGQLVPAGYYDRARGVWTPSENGRIVQVVDVSDGMATLDVDGDGAADVGEELIALGVTEAEQRRLATFYQPGQSLWRVPIPHFTPWDFNWPYTPPDDAEPPQQPEPQLNFLLANPTCQGGSIIECENQVLGETVSLPGTPFALHYKSDRVPGHRQAYTMHIPLSGARVAASLKRIDLVVAVAGRRFLQSFSAVPHQETTFVWDGQDAYGRMVQGVQPVIMDLGYVYDAVYREPAQLLQSFGAFSDAIITANRARQEITLWQRRRVSLGLWDARIQTLGGWSLTAHHAYDAMERALYFGYGGRRNANALGQVITTVAGDGTPGDGGDGGPAIQAQLSPYGVAVGPDGSLYVTDGSRIRQVSLDGRITTVAGTGTYGESGDGGPATSAQLYAPYAVAVDSQGTLFIAESYGLGEGHGNRVRKVSPDGIITTVAGTGMWGYSGDGGPATSAQLFLGFDAGAIAVDGQGNLFIADTWNYRVRKVSPDGRITTVAGNGQEGSSGDGGPATSAALNGPTAVAVDRQGNLFITEDYGYRIRKVSPNGIITTVAGTGNWGYSGDGGPATNAELYDPSALAVDWQGSLFIAEAFGNRVRKVSSDGIITTVAGTEMWGYSGDGSLATAAQFDIPTAVALDAEGNLFIADSGNSRVRKVFPRFPGFAAQALILPSADSQEVYEFDEQGRHRRTLETLTRAIQYQFTYNHAGQLVQMADGDGNLTVIERDAAGLPTAIIGPFGQRTTLSLDGNGYLSSVTTPAGETRHFTSTADGLLTSMTDPNGHQYRFSYDPLGRLMRDEDPAGGFKALTRADSDTAFTVSLTNALGRTSTYQVERPLTGGMRRVNTDPRGLRSVTEIGTDGSQRRTTPDGTVTTALEGPDPRFGMQAPLLQSLAVMTPGGLTSTMTRTRTVALADPLDLLSLTQLTDTVSVNGRLYTSIYDAASRTVTSQTPAGRRRISLLDAQGRVLEERVDGLEPIRFTYDSLGRLGAVAHGSRTSVLTYDAQGLLASLTDPLGRSVGFAYNLAGRLSQQTLPDGREIVYMYDANGNLTSIAPPGRPSHAFAYTPVDLESAYLPPELEAGPTPTHYAYNLDRQLVQVTRPNGTTLDVGYDGAGRLGTVTSPRGQLGFSYLPATGHLATITAPDGGTVTYSYDGSLLTGETWSGSVAGSVQYAYDKDFRLTSQRINGEVLATFQYDADGLLTQAGALTLIRHPQHGLLTGSTVGQITDIRTLNTFGELERYRAAFRGINIFATHYVRDALGRITQKAETLDGQTNIDTYEYDRAGRLTRVQRNGSPVAAYAYDGNGNRLSYNSPEGTVTGTYDVQDRLTQYGSTTYTYTANGELSSKTTGAQTTTYTYDALGNLTVATLPDGTQVEYLIDGRNRRVGKKVNGTLVQGFLYSGQLRPVAELDGSGTITARFIYGTRGNVPDYLVKGGHTYRILTDHLGSPRLIIDTGTGHVVQRLAYDAFGQVIYDDNPGFQPFGFAGGLYDPDTKLTRFGARDYDAETGRWTAKDPIRFLGGDPNLYGYVLNDPVNWVDPWGRTQCDIDTAARLIQEVHPDLKFPRSIEIDPTISPDSMVVGRYYWEAQRVTLNPRYLEKLAAQDADELLVTILHEIVHHNDPLWKVRLDANRDHPDVDKRALELAKKIYDLFQDERGKKCP
jgi:RHS repeat-associated protein